MAQHTINLPCVADTYVDSENRYTNYGNATQLLIGQKYQYQQYEYYKMALFKFDTSTLPVRKKIIKGELKVFINSINLDQGGHVGADIAGDFDEYTATYEINMSSAYYVSRELGGLSTNQYQNIEIKMINGFRVIPPYVYVMDVHGNGNPYNTYMNISSREGANPPILVVTYEDVPPSKPSLNEPIGSFEINSEIIRLSWNYISSVGGVQKGYSLQWSTDQETWTTINQTTANTYYDVPADIFPAGNIYWRVKTINEYDEESEYSDVAAFYSVGAPETPVIQSVAQSARPTITWTASGQQVFQVQVLKDSEVIYDSGILPGIWVGEHKVPIYLQNGEYEARVRIKNEYDMFSEWGFENFVLDVEQPEKPTLNIQRTAYGLEMHILNASDKALIYRDGVCIAEITGEWFIDYSVASGTEYEYFVRSVNESEAFTDSDQVTAKAELKGNLFAPVSDLSSIVNLKFNMNDIPSKSTAITPMGTQTYLSGRTHPIMEFTEHEDNSMSFQFFIRDHEELKAVKALVSKKETVLFRDGRSRKVYGIITGLNITDHRSGYQVSFTLSQVDYSEEVS